MMKMIKPIVNISKVIETYDTVIVGFDGILYDGKSFKSEAVNALVNLKKNGFRVVLLSNTDMRVEKIIRLMTQNKVPVMVFDAMMTAGEILHYKLKSSENEFAGIGRRYYVIGSRENLGIFANLDYEEVNDPSKADFLYMGSCEKEDDLIDHYLPVLEHAAGMNIPLVCAGNDTSSYKNGEISLAPGAVAEQYAVLGGRIVTIGKPDIKLFDYVLDDIPNLDKDKILMIGDNLATDIKGANLYGISAALISKGVHINFLGEGYIPDVAKTRELSTNFDAYPDYIISNLRW